MSPRQVLRQVPAEAVTSGRIRARLALDAARDGDPIPMAVALATAEFIARGAELEPALRVRVASARRAARAAENVLAITS